MLRRSRLARGLLAALALLAPRAAAAAWSTNGNAVCTASGAQTSPVMSSDGNGGFFVVWQDTRGGASDLYAQRLTAAGAVFPGWPANGLAVCTAAGDQRLPVIAPDGAGGFYLAWEDYRVGGGESDVYLQRVTGAGALAGGWPAGGLGVCTETSPQGYPSLVAEGGAVMVAWQDDRSALSSDIYAQRVSAAGAVQWTAGGIPLCVAAGNQLFPAVVGDGSGGAFVVWQDARDGDPDVYAQRVSSAGAAQWTGDGVAVCTALYEQLAPRLVADASGGVILVWDDYRDFNADIYAQRLSGAGARQWAAGGVALCTDLAEQYGASVVSDGAGGAIVPWTDYRGGSGDLYAQRITAAGAVQWGTDGSSMCGASGDQFDAAAVPDLAGGMYLVWSDARAGTGTADIYAKRVTSSGATASGWNANGTKVCDAVNAQQRPAVLADGAGCFVSWADDRGTDTDLYAFRAGGSSSVDVPVTIGEPIRLAPPFPNPARAGVSLRFQLTQEGPVRLSVLDLAGRRIRVLADESRFPVGAHVARWDGRDESGSQVPAGLYVVTLETAGGRDLKRLTVLR